MNNIANDKDLLNKFKLQYNIFMDIENILNNGRYILNSGIWGDIALKVLAIKRTEIGISIDIMYLIHNRIEMYGTIWFEECSEILSYTDLVDEYIKNRSLKDMRKYPLQDKLDLTFTESLIIEYIKNNLYINKNINNLFKTRILYRVTDIKSQISNMKNHLYS